MNIEFTKTFTSPVFGYCYPGKKTTANEKQGQKMIDAGHAVLVDDKKTESKAVDSKKSSKTTGKK